MTLFLLIFYLMHLSSDPIIYLDFGDSPTRWQFALGKEPLQVYIFTKGINFSCKCLLTRYLQFMII